MFEPNSATPDGPQTPPADAALEPSLGGRVADLAEDIADAALTDAPFNDSHEDGVASTQIEAPARQAATRRGNRAVMASPLLALPRARHPEALVLFVHGGDVTGNLRVKRGDPGYLRLIPFARDVERRTHGLIGAALIRLSVRGWNEPELPAVDDARWALKRLRQQYPSLPIAVAGHSMGGRVMFELINHDDVTAGLGLAPWASDKYGPERFGTKPLLIVHGRHDHVTSPTDSADLVARIRQAGGDARFESLPGGHTMLRSPMRWHRASSDFLSTTLLGDR